MIEHYSFGCMRIAGREYRSDLMVFPDGRVRDSWWRETGHRLSAEDITELIDSGPDILIAGTGASGLMVPDAELEQKLGQRGVTFIALCTGKAAERFNGLCGEKKVAACFHLTC